MKFVSFSIIVCCLWSLSTKADECTEMMDLYIQELKESLDERVDYTKPHDVSNAVRELEFIEMNRNLIPDCELAKGILVIEPITKNE
ncbi:hypothetical protein [Alteromonas ponticola]|uniref:Uncharacterized protein n=1 Tax=Alteromonas ponticola TaxID=2720613 RepID=A0ABX1R257_9ALTE|nr:hypothetical protein [Alteromonas ponticola]NMH60554.1 hypothetical protein [Alteromonas ponticola]